MKSKKIVVLLIVLLNALFLLVTCSQAERDTLLNMSINLDKIEITGEPSRKIYFIGDDIDLTGLEVTAIYSDNSSNKIPLENLEITGFDTTEAMEEQNITVIYKEKTAGFIISVNSLVRQVDILELIITNLPAKTVYYEGDTISEDDLAGLTVSAYEGNGTISLIPVTIDNVSGFDSSNPGKKTITITYQGLTTDFTVNVNAVVLTEIKITEQPDKTVYYIGDTLTDNDLAGLEVTAYYNNGTSSPVTVTAGDITGFNTATTGDKNLTVTYQQKTTFLPIRVNEGVLSGIRIIRAPVKKYYKMGEEIVTTGLVVENVYHNGYVKTTNNYTVTGNTFTAGSVGISVTSTINTSKTTSFNINVSNELIDTGLPVIYIDTENAAPIVSQEDWLNMRVKVVSDKPEWSFEKTDNRDQIRGRGNTSWHWAKKPYRMKFRENTSMFGFTAARDWVLLADYKVATLMSNTVAFEMGQRFDGPLFKNNYVYVNVVLNGQYNGLYILTEHMRVGKGRVEINENTDYLVELDTYYDEDPKFKTPKLKLPVMIKSPDFGTDIKDPRYQFIIDSFNEYDALISNVNFPNNGWQEKIDMDSFIDYLMINEIVLNGELNHPKSVYMCKTAEGKIRMSHLWDFDWALGLGGGRSVDVSSAKSRYKGGKFNQFHKDIEFTTRYKARWNEKYPEIQSMLTFIDTTAESIRVSHSLNNKRWYNGAYNFDVEVDKLRTWWSDRIDYLNSEINK